MWPVRLWSVTEFHWQSHHNRYKEMGNVRGRELLLTNGTFDRLYQISISCEFVVSIRASTSTSLFFSTLISFFSFFLPFHLHAPRPSFLLFFRASSFFFLFILSLFSENCVGRRLTKAYTFSVHLWIQFSHLRVNHMKLRKWQLLIDGKTPLNYSALILYFLK